MLPQRQVWERGVEFSLTGGIKGSPWFVKQVAELVPRDPDQDQWKKVGPNNNIMFKYLSKVLSLFVSIFCQHFFSCLVNYTTVSVIPFQYFFVRFLSESRQIFFFPNEKIKIFITVNCMLENI